MSTVLQILFSGLTVGAIYSLVAIGFTLVYQSSGVINFAQGEFVMLGGMLTATAIATGLGIVPAVAVACAVTVLVGIALHVLAIEMAHGASATVLIIITIGASVFLRGMASVYMGKDFHVFPPFLPVKEIDVGGASLQTQGALVVFGAIVILICLWLLLQMTATGRGIRATAANRLAAQLAGINPSLIVGLTFAISALIGAIGGVLVTPIALTSYDVGTMLAIKGFAAAMLGGLTHPAGPVVGGIAIGLMEAFGAGYISSAYKDLLAFAMLLAVLFVRPAGLFGRNVIERV